MNRYNQYILIILGLFSFTLYAEVPANIQRSEIELERGSLDTYRASVKVQAATGQTSSQLTQKSGSIKNLDLKLGSKFVFGKVTDTTSRGIALSPDANVRLRFDESGKLLRLELDGRVVSLLDFQSIHIEGALDEGMRRYLREEKNRLEERKERQKLFKEDTQEISKRIRAIEGALKADEQAKLNPKTYATIDLSVLNGGAKYKDLKDALYKFYGFSGSLATFSFDTAAKSKKGGLRLGLCGVFDFLNLDYGHHKNPISNSVTGAMGVSGQLCLRLGLGPVTLTNTFGASWNTISNERDNSNVAINNTARLGVKSNIIPGAISEVGAFYTHNREWYNGGQIESNMVGAGITVLAK